MHMLQVTLAMLWPIIIVTTLLAVSVLLLVFFATRKLD